MKKELIQLQFGSCATCVIILDEYYKELGSTIFMEGNMSDTNLYACSYENPIFKEKLETMAKNYEQVYFVIRHIEQITEEEQNRYIALVKDREFCGFQIPINVVIVFTIEKERDIKKISKELYHFCVIAI